MRFLVFHNEESFASYLTTDRALATVLTRPRTPFDQWHTKNVADRAAAIFLKLRVNGWPLCLNNES